MLVAGGFLCCTQFTHHAGAAAELVEHEGEVAVLVLGGHKHILLPQGIHGAVPGAIWMRGTSVNRDRMGSAWVVSGV